MLDTITIRKGLDIPIGGTAEWQLTDARSITTYAMKPTDFVIFASRNMSDAINKSKGFGKTQDYD